MGFVGSCINGDVVKLSKPEFVACPNCGADVKIWTDKEVTNCKNCGKTISR